ncbi:hypothetical protein BCF53_105128 [Reinekea marinisedimentorum]|uniref:Uncharacterized protein n=2 Tax=Reinekea marinisedimentorum TaxID=230495 RepID=A0A4R3I8P1_9GAMM|nr:hypothetical protein BCF53_105128 [Reinekea marinisedimentorum]
MLSFLVSDFSWPSDPVTHRALNLAIHLINFCLISLILGRLLIFKGMSSSRAFLFASFVALYWAVIPVNSGPVLSVVQRMTSISAMFSYVAMLVFTLWRISPYASVRKTLFVFVFIFQLGLLAVLSKESALLLPGYILLIELWVSRCFILVSRLYRYLIRAVVFVFVFGVLVINLRAVADSSGWWLRDFTAIDRALVELIIIIPQYALKVFTLKISGTGMMVGHSNLDEWYAIGNIAWSVLFWIGSAFCLLKGSNSVRICVLWYFTGHLLESLFVPLELYFEHRNYISSLGLVVLLIMTAERYLFDHSKIIALLISIFVFLIVMIGFSNQQYDDPLELAAVYAEENPLSKRAQSNFVWQLIKHARFEQALNEVERLPPIVRERLKFLLMCNSEEGATLLPELFEGSVDAAYISFIRDIVGAYRKSACMFDSAALHEYLSPVLAASQVRDRYKVIILFEKAQLYAADHDLNGALTTLDLAIGVEAKDYLLSQKAYWAYSAGLTGVAIDAAKKSLSVSSRCHYIRYPCDSSMVLFLEHIAH